MLIYVNICRYFFPAFSCQALLTWNTKNGILCLDSSSPFMWNVLYNNPFYMGGCSNKFERVFIQHKRAVRIISISENLVKIFFRKNSCFCSLLTLPLYSRGVSLLSIQNCVAHGRGVHEYYTRVKNILKPRWWCRWEDSCCISSNAKNVSNSKV